MNTDMNMKNCRATRRAGEKPRLKALRSSAKRAAAAFLGCLCLTAAAAPQAQARELRNLSLQEAVDLALRDSKAWAQFDARAQTAENQVQAVKANWWPKITADASALWFTDASDLEIVDKEDMQQQMGAAVGEAEKQLAADPMLGTLLETSGATIKAAAQTIAAPLMNAIPESMRLKDQFTFTVGAQITMPLTPLFKVYHGSKLAEMAVENIETERSAKALDISYEVTDVYLKLVYAQLMTEVAAEASDTIEKHVELAEKYESVGMISHSDVLAARVEALKAKQNIVEATNSTRLASLKLAQVLSIGGAIELRATDMPEDGFAVELGDLEYYQQKALENRNEFKRLDIGERAAQKRETIALLDYVPQVFLIGRYQYTHGISVLEPANQGIFGVAMTWTIFDGLASHYNAKQASFEAAEYSAKTDEAHELIALDVAQKYLALSTALERVKLTGQALELADENLRTISAQFAQGESVNTDVLAAQTRRTSARADDVKAHIDILAAYAGLKLAVGESPVIERNAFK